MNPLGFLYSFLYFMLIVPVCTLTVLLIFLVSSILCFGFLSPFLVFLYTIIFSQKSSILHRMLLIYSTLSVTIIVSFSCQFAVRMLGFLIMGIILNAEFVVPYLTFAFVVAQKIYLCYRNTQNKYKEIKDIFADKAIIHVNDTIPAELFWLVSDRVLPISKEILSLFSKILAIVVFLSVALTAILLFKVTYGASVIVTTISVFISGKFSELFFTGLTKGSNFVGWEKIQLKEAIASVVQEHGAKIYISRVRNGLIF